MDILLTDDLLRSYRVVQSTCSDEGARLPECSTYIFPSHTTLHCVMPPFSVTSAADAVVLSNDGAWKWEDQGADEAVSPLQAR